MAKRKKKVQSPPLCSCKLHYRFQPCPKQWIRKESFTLRLARERYPYLFDE